MSLEVPFLLSAISTLKETAPTSYKYKKKQENN